MRKLQLLILSIATILFISCGSLTIATESQPYDFYYDNYDYNQINMMYLNNPRWFYNNSYMDSYGHPHYYHTHPYYIRYVKEHQRRMNPRSNNSRKIKRTNHNTGIRKAPIVIPNRGLTTTKTKTRTIRPRTTRSTVRSTPTRSVRRNSSSTIRRSNSQAVKRSNPIKRTSSVKRRN